MTVNSVDNSDGASVAATWRFLAVGSLEVEPEPPRPFTFSGQLIEDQRPYRSLFRSLSTTSQAHGWSEDSGIYELSNRRRPAPYDVLEFSLRLSEAALQWPLIGGLLFEFSLQSCLCTWGTLYVSFSIQNWIRIALQSSVSINRLERRN